MIDAIDRPQFRSPGDDADRGRPIRVLLVEDEAAHVRIVQRAFETRSAFELQTAGSIAAARQAIESKTPDLVIADVILPDGRGLDLIGPAESQKYGVVIMTAQGDESTAVEALKRGALDYVVKSAETLVDLPEVAMRAIRVREHIEARRTAEERLENEERRLRAVLDAIPDLIVVISRDGRFVECRGGKRQFGPDVAADFVGKDLTSVVGGDSQTALRRSIDEVLATRGIREVVVEMTLRGERR